MDKVSKENLLADEIMLQLYNAFANEGKDL